MALRGVAIGSAPEGVSATAGLTKKTVTAMIAASLPQNPAIMMLLSWMIVFAAT
jgi:hypothetical protein